MKNRSDNIVFSILQEHPSVAAGFCTFAVAFSLVAGNAIYAQSGSHPEPIWATRDHVTTHSIQPKVSYKVDAFKPVVRPVETTMHKPRTAVTPTVTAVKKIASSPLVASVQKGLLESGDYKGTVDGQMGPMTRAAVIAYQTRYGLEADGFATKTLLKIIELNVPKQASIPAPQQEKTVTAYDSNIVKKVQLGLYNFGESQVAIDGVYGSQTKAAIERFQEKFNLTKNGIPDLALVKTLIAKQALPSG